MIRNVFGCCVEESGKEVSGLVVNGGGEWSIPILPVFAIEVEGHVVHNIRAKEAWNFLGGALRIASESGLKVGKACMEVVDFFSNGGDSLGEGLGGKFG